MNLDAIGIASRDLEKTIKFYSLFGVELHQVGGPDHFEGKTSTGLRLMVDSFELMKKINPSWQEPVGSNITLCFKQKTASDVDGLFIKITEAGFRVIKEPWDAFWGQRYASVLDPDGNQIDIFANL